MEIQWSGDLHQKITRGEESTSASHIEIKLDAASNALIGSFRNKPTPHIIFLAMLTEWTCTINIFPIIKHN